MKRSPTVYIPLKVAGAEEYMIKAHGNLLKVGDRWVRLPSTPEKVLRILRSELEPFSGPFVIEEATFLGADGEFVKKRFEVVGEF